MSNRSLASAKAARTGNGAPPRVSGGGPRVSIGSAAQFGNRPPTHNVRAPIHRAPPRQQPQPPPQPYQPIMQPRQQEQLTSSLTIPQVISMMTVRISEMECWINKQKEERMGGGGGGGEQDEGFTHTEMGAILDRIGTLERKVGGYDKLISTNQLSVTNKLKSIASKIDAAVKSNEEIVNLVCQRVESIESILQENYKENEDENEDKEEDEDKEKGRDETGDCIGSLDAADDDIFMEEDGEGEKGNDYEDSEPN